MDKIEQIYNLYLSKGLITNKTTLDNFKNANETQLSQLYDLGIKNKVFQKTDFDTFSSAWNLKKKDVSDSTVQNQNSDLEAQDTVGSSDLQEFPNYAVLPEEQTQRPVFEEQNTSNKNEIERNINAINELYAFEDKNKNTLEQIEQRSQYVPDYLQNQPKEVIDAYNEFSSLDNLTEQELQEIDNTINQQKKGNYGILSNWWNTFKTNHLNMEDTRKVSKKEDLIAEKKRQKRIDYLNKIDNPELRKNIAEIKLKEDFRSNQKIKDNEILIQQKALQANATIENIYRLEEEQKKINDALEKEKDPKIRENLINQGRKNEELFNQYKTDIISIQGEAESLYNEIEENAQDISTFDDELDLLKRSYQWLENQKQTLKLGYADVANSALFQVRNFKNNLFNSENIFGNNNDVLEKNKKQILDDALEFKKETNRQREFLEPKIQVKDIKNISDFTEFMIASTVENIPTLHQFSLGGAGVVSFGVTQQANESLDIRQGILDDKKRLQEILDVLSNENSLSQLNDEEISRLKNEKKNILGKRKLTELDILLTSSAFAGAEVALGYLGKIRLVNKGKRVASSIGTNELKSITEKNILKNFGKETWDFVKDATGEGLEEIGTGTFKDIVEIGYFKDKLDDAGNERTVGSDAFDNFVGGFSVGTNLSGTTKIVGNSLGFISDRKRRKQVGNNTLEAMKILQQANAEGVPSDVKEILLIEAEKLFEENKSIINSTKEDWDSLSESDKTKIRNINNKIRSLNISLDTIKDKKTISLVEDNIKGLESLKEGILKQKTTDNKSTVSSNVKDFADKVSDNQEDVSRFVKGALKITVGDSDVILKDEGDNIKIESISTATDKRGQGSAKNAINEVIQVADAEGKTLELNVVPLDDTTNAEQLVEFYESVGFVKEDGFDIDGGRMVRVPQQTEDTFSGIDSVLNEEKNVTIQENDLTENDNTNVNEEVNTKKLDDKKNVPIQVSTNKNNYTVELRNGKLNIIPEFGNKKLTNSERSKVEEQYIAQTNFDTGKRVSDTNRGNISEDQISDIIATESENPVEVANEIIRKQTQDNVSGEIRLSKIGAIAQALNSVQVNKESFAQTDDRNNIADVNPYYFNPLNKTKKGNDGNIDTIREVAQQYTDETVEMSDITDFMKEYRNPNKIQEDTQTDTFDLEQRFEKLTGLKPTKSNIEKVAQKSTPTQETETDQDTEDSEVPFQTESNQTGISGKALIDLVNRLKKTGLAKAVKILSDNQINNFLKNLGIDNINDKAQLSAKGITETPFGFVYQEEVYINSDKVKTDTPIHEFSHLWNAYIKENNPQVYNRGLQLIENSEYHKAVKENPAYQHLDKEGQLEEALAQAIGEKGVKILNESRKAKFNAWFRNLFNKIAKGLGLRSMTGEQLSNLTLDKFTDLASAELLSGQKIGEFKQPKTPRNQVQDSNVSNIDVILAEQKAIKETKNNLRQKFRDRDVFTKDIKNELVKYIQSNIDSKRFNELQKSELNKLLNLVKKAKTKNNLLDAFNQVNDIVVKLDNKNLLSRINKILNKKFSKKESGRRKANITDEQTEKILNTIKDNISNLNKEEIATPLKRNKSNLIDERLDNLYAIKESLELNDGDLSEIEAISISIDILNSINNSDPNVANEILIDSLESIESLYNDGRSKLKEAREKRQQEDNELLTNLINDANPEGKTSNKSVDTLKNDNKNQGNPITRTLQRAFHYWFRGKVTASLDAIATIISKKGGDTRDSSAWVQFVNRLKKQETLKKARIRKFANKWKKAQIDLFGSLTQADKLLNKKIEIEVDVLPKDSQLPKNKTLTENVTYTYSQLLNVWQNYKNPDLRSGLANNGFTDRVVEKIENILPQKVKDYGNALIDIYEEMYIDSNEVYKSMNFHSLGKPPFYAGKVYREGMDIKEDTNALLGGNMGINTTGYGSQKERVINNNPINAIDVNTLFNRSLQESSHYVAFAEVHRQYNKLLRDPNVQKAILLNNGNNGDQILQSLLYYKVRDLEQGGERGNRVVDALGRNIARSVLGLKAKIGITQTISIINGSFDLPKNITPKEFAENYNPLEIVKNIKHLLKNSEYMQNRYDVGGLENAVTGLESLTKENTFKFNNSSIEAKRKASARFYKKATDFMLSNVKYGDMVGVLGATPVYSAWKARYLKQGLSEAEAESKAMAQFEASVDRAQQSISSFGKSQLQKDPYLRYLMMFATAPIQNLQNANYHRRELMKSLRGKEYKGSNVRNALAFLNYQFAQPMLYTYISNILVGSISNALGLGDEEPNDADKSLLSSAILGNVQSVPLIGGILLYTIDKVVLDKEFTFANIIGSPLYDEIKKTEDHIKKAVESKKPETQQKHIFEAIKKTSGILGGIPNFSFDVFNDWDDVYWSDNVNFENKVYRALGYSKSVIKNKNKENNNKPKNREEVRDNLKFRN